MTAERASERSWEVGEMKIYISGPMTGLPDNNYPAFFRVAEIVRNKGHEPINPAEGAPEGWAWAQYMRRALRMLMDADEVWMLPGWTDSAGARLEYHVATHLSMIVRQLDPDNFMPHFLPFVETCDTCGKLLDQLLGEDFYDEESGHVYCEEHWPFKENDCLRKEPCQT